MKTVVTIEEQKDGKLGVRMEFDSANGCFTKKERAFVDKVTKLLPKRNSHICLQWPSQATLIENGHTVDVDDLSLPGVRKLINDTYPNNMLGPKKRL